MSLVITIDWWSGTGKWTTAQWVAGKLWFSCLDTGAMYRAVTVFMLENEIDVQDAQMVINSLSAISLRFVREDDKQIIYLNNTNVEDVIRTHRVSQYVSIVAAIPEVRWFLQKQQREIALCGNIVMDGRDMGTVVCPEAWLKIFLTASVPVRAKRRQVQLAEKWEHVSLESLIRNIEERDYNDSNRTDSPLKKPEGAIEIDTSNLTIQQQIQQIVDLARQRI